MAKAMADLLSMLRQPGPTRLGFGLAVGVFIADQLTKLAVLRGLDFSPEGCLEFQKADPSERLGMVNNCGHIDVSPIFDLTMVWNRGVSFGLFAADDLLGRLILVTFSVVVAGILLAGLFRRGPFQAERPLQAVAFGMIIGGALGNAIDRVIYGAVADFLNFSELYFPWVFNIADVGINLGVAALILDMLLAERAERKQTPRE